jgi:hypothetical protein
MPCSDSKNENSCYVDQKVNPELSDEKLTNMVPTGANEPLIDTITYQLAALQVDRSYPQGHALAELNPAYPWLIGIPERRPTLGRFSVQAAKPTVRWKRGVGRLHPYVSICVCTFSSSAPVQFYPELLNRARGSEALSPDGTLREQEPAD